MSEGKKGLQSQLLLVTIYSRPLLPFLVAVLLGKVVEAPLLTRNHYEPFALEKRSTPGWISLLKFCCRNGAT